MAIKNNIYKKRINVKRFIYLITLLASLPICAFATEPDKLYGGGVQSKEMELLANRICSQLINSETTDKLSGPMAFKSSVAEYLKIDINAKDTRKKVIEFWNLKKDQLICTHKNIKYTSPQPVMRRIIDMKIQEEVFFEFLLEDENDDYEGKVDINIVHVNPKGESETVLDYIQSIRDDTSKAGHYDFDELADLQESLQEEYGGKYVKYAKQYPEYALEGY
jgi:hypothetical protein